MKHAETQPNIWFKGKPEEAFAVAKAQNKLIFLYWGAVWCPPCNELKSEVFSKPRFAELMLNFVPVYLDGDTEEAQIWGDRLSISGYPTIMVLDAASKELLRLNASLNEEEFSLAIQSVQQKNRNFGEVLARLEQGKTQQEDWRFLAYTSWEQLPAEKFDSARILNAAKRAADHCPPQLERERALLAANLLSLVSATPSTDGSKSIIADVKSEIKKYFDIIFANNTSIQITRPFINNSTGQVLEFMYGKAKGGKGYVELKNRWLKAAKEIAALSSHSVDTRLGALMPMIEFNHFENPDKPVPPALKAQIQKAVAKADQAAKTPFERHAVISNAAHLLRQVGDYAGARVLLVTEAGRSDTPWYY
ncbi:MAG: thioredoxin family protein, partial [Proteobacteria bacterium]|nr:thioredoxin family protein [Pseudomonadota bacterium]